MNQQMTFVFPILLVVVFYFLLIRPQKKREKQINEMRSNLKVGNKVITIGGIYGKIIKIKGDILTLEVGADKVRIPFSRWAISGLDNDSNQNIKDNKKQDDKKEVENKTEEETVSDDNVDANKDNNEK